MLHYRKIFVVSRLRAYRKSACVFLCVTALCVSMIASLRAQHYVGIEQSSYMPLEQIHLNPAKIVDSRMKFDVNIFSASYFFNNNYFFTRPIFPVLAQGSRLLKRTNLLTQSPNDPLLAGLRTMMDLSRGKLPDLPRPAQMIAMTEYRGPSFILNLGKDLKRKHTVGFFLKARTITSIDGLNRNYLDHFTQAISDNLSPEAQAARLDNIRYRFQNGMSYTTNVFNEIGISYGIEVYRSPKHIVSLGLSLKRYNGIYLSALKVNNLFMRFDAPPVLQNNQRAAHVEADMTYVNSNPTTTASYISPLRMFDYSQIANGNGGWGMDIGVTYAFVPDPKKYEIIDSANNTFKEVRCENKYLVKISLSLTDLGYMRYNIPNQYTLQTLGTNVQNWNTRVNDALFLQHLLFSQPPDQNTRVTVIAPTMLRGDIDFKFSPEKKILRDLYLNVGYNQSIGQYIANDNQFANVMWNYATVAPRYERADWEVSLPVTSFFTNTPQKPFVRIGVSARYKYFFIGTTDITSILSVPNTQGGGVYAGLKYGVAYKCPKPFEDSLRIQDSLRLVPDSLKDRDHDGVPDVRDKCIDTPGVASNYGCPLNQDSLFENSLLKTPWHKLFRDSTADINPEKKPYLDTLAAILKANPRFEILVSGEADDPAQGKKKMDSLAEARTDSLLAYLTRAGAQPKQLIGVAMRSEQPLHIVPPFRQHIVGKDDERDGVLDNIDRCPTIPGLLTEEGCPATDQSNEEKFATSLGEKVEFWKGMGTFAYSSENNLDEVASIMKKNPRLRLLVRAFVGREIKDREAKKKLAQDRADTIKNYIVRKGVDANRIIPLGMSPYEPLGSVPTIKYIQGAEDGDRDKTLDTLDRCPTLRGLSNLEGCPPDSIGDIYLRIDSLANLIKFLPDKEEFDLSAAPIMMQIIDILRAHPNINILVSGIVNSTKLSNKQKNKLADLRAAALKNYLVGFGVDERRIDAVGIDWQQPTYLVSTMRVLSSHLSDGEGDGVKDYEDKCPTLEGTIANYGCPQVVYEEEELLSDLDKMIVFKPNKAEVRDTVYKHLDKLVEFMKRNSNVNLITYGNLYNSGLSPEKQDKLNWDRAIFLRNYLIERGVHPGRVNPVGISYLEKQPWLVPNVTAIANTQDQDGDGVKDIYDRCPHTVGSAYNYGCPYDVAKIASAVAGFSRKVFFNTGKYDLLAPTIKVLDRLVRMMEDDMSLRFVIAGSADSTGSQKINQPLSLNRAVSVRNYLVQKGIAADRLIPIGLSDKFPIGDNKTGEGRQQNRSVRFQLLE